MRIPVGTKAVAVAESTKRTKHATKATKAATKEQKHVRAGWKVGLPLRADGTTGQNDCLCGCGTKVKNRFAQGHDARVHSWLLAVERGERTIKSLPAETQRALANGVLFVKADQPTDGHVLAAPKPQPKKEAAQKTTKAA